MIAEVYGVPATALHFVIETGDIDRVRWLLERGADPAIRDGVHDSSAIGWADFFGQREIQALLEEQAER